jgi:branched-chain amino acid transport system ATP-binding protein
VLELSNVTTTYRGMVAISDISFTVRAGEILTIAGANGAGKSTLLKTIAGMERAQTGAILFEEEPINQDPPHRITQRGIAFVPEARRLFSRLSVRDNLRLGSYLYRKKTDRDQPLERVFSLFPRLKERLDQRAETLSGGEQQMLGIGRALMSRPRLLMLDEPSQGIMPKLVDEIFGAIQSIRSAGVTIILVEQRLADSLEIADRAIILRTGRIIMQGTAAEVRDHPEIRSAYLGI